MRLACYVVDLIETIRIFFLGFGLCGTAETIITAMAKRKDLQDLTVVSNNAGNAGDDGLCKFSIFHSLV
jgi:3-oxoacid CoA-transferase